jgi:tetratricopeptide (TPR) repeat protein
MKLCSSKCGLLIIILLTVLVYFPGLGGDYVFDDFSNILKNKRLTIDSVNFSEIKEAALSSKAGKLQRPVSMLSFSFNRSLWGNNPFSFKAVNLLIHILNGIGLYFLTSILIRRYGKTSGNLKTSPNIYALLTAGIWLVHPINLTSVLYIVQRMTSLSALFAILAMYLYCVYREKVYLDRKGYAYLWLSVLLFTPLSVLSKENGVLIPLLLFIIEACLYRFKSEVSEGVDKVDSKIILLFLFILILPGIGGLYFVMENPNRIFSAYSYREFGIVERLLTESRVLVFYLKMILIPNITELGLYHDDFTLSRTILNPLGTLGALILIVGALLTGIVLVYKKSSLLGFGLCWFFAWHVLESTIIPLELAHEHRNYLASYGILLAVVYFLIEGASKVAMRGTRVAIVATIMLLFGFVTYLRSEQWSDNISQATYEAIHHPQSPRAVFAAGRIYANIALTGEEGWDEKAFTYLSRAADLDESGILPEASLILLTAQRGKTIDPDWVNSIARKLRNRKMHSNAITALKQIVLCVSKKKCEISGLYIHTIFESALGNVNLNQVFRQKADLVTIYAEYFVNVEGNLVQGEKFFREAITLAPKEVQFYVNLANLLIITGRFEEAGHLIVSAKRADALGIYDQLIRSLEADMELAVTTSKNS